MTDSAAAATAFSTGFKSFNGAIGVDAQGRPRPTLLEDARKMGKATGLVTTPTTRTSPATSSPRRTARSPSRART